MDFELLYWHWFVFGIGLMLAEIFIGSFFIFWFGAAAIAVALVLLVAPTVTVVAQLIIWGVSSTLFAVAWFKLFKPFSQDKTKAGLSKEALLGEIGHVLTPPNGEKRGTVRFLIPLLGSDEWQIISKDSLQIGDRVSVLDLSGNALIVKKA